MLILSYCCNAISIVANVSVDFFMFNYKGYVIQGFYGKYNTSLTNQISAFVTTSISMCSIIAYFLYICIVNVRTYVLCKCHYILLGKGHYGKV